MPLGTPLLSATIDIATVADHDIVAAVSAKKVYVFGMWLWSNGIVTITITDEDTANLAGDMDLVAQSSLEWPLREEPWFTTTAGNAFSITLAQAIRVSGRVYYVQQ